MRTTVLAALALGAAAAAPASAATGHLTPTAGTVVVEGRGAYTGFGLAGHCTYDGGTLTMTVVATAPVDVPVHVEGECVLYTDRVANGVWDDGSGGRPLAVAGGVRQVEPGVRAERLCLLASATWADGADSVWRYECVEA